MTSLSSRSMIHNLLGNQSDDIRRVDTVQRLLQGNDSVSLGNECRGSEAPPFQVQASFFISRKLQNTISLRFISI